jgi:flagellar protein FliS
MHGRGTYLITRRNSSRDIRDFIFKFLFLYLAAIRPKWMGGVMNSNKLKAYQDTRLLTTQPGTLARIALEECLKATRTAIAELKAGHILQRSRAVTRAINLLTAFAAMLSDSAGPEVCLNLRRVCDYCQRRLMEAHAKQSESMMAEVVGLLQPVTEAWRTVERRSPAELVQT